MHKSHAEQHTKEIENESEVWSGKLRTKNIEYK